MNQTTEPFNNLKVREAVNYAVDPAALERIYTGQIVGTQQILPPGMPGYEKFELFPHDVKKAKELVAESGVKDKESPSGRTPRARTTTRVPTTRASSKKSGSTWNSKSSTPTTTSP